MKKFCLYSGVATLFFTHLAYAQFGSGIVYDPTQSAHAAQQIMQAGQLYTTTLETAHNIVGVYNLARRMASAPRSLYTAYSSTGMHMWTTVTRSQDTFGNTRAWMKAITTGDGAVLGSQQVSVVPVARISGYGALDSLGQQQTAAQGATADLNDAVNATTLETLGTIRASASQREDDISRLESASHSTDPDQQTQLATLQRINQALLIELRTQQEANEMKQAQTLLQLVGQKQQQDELKMTFHAADGYQTNYKSNITTSPSSVANAYHH